MSSNAKHRHGARCLGAAIGLSLLCGLSLADAGHCQLALQPADNLNDDEELYVIRTLEALYPESMGFRVEGPLEPEGGTGEDFARIVKAFRVVVPPEVTVNEAARMLNSKNSPFKPLLDHGGKGEFLPEAPVGYSGVLTSARLKKKLVDLQFITVNMNRWLIWARSSYFPLWQGDRDTPLQEYAAAVSQYMRRNDFGKVHPEVPKASAVGAPARADLYRSTDVPEIEPGEFASLVMAYREMDMRLGKGVLSVAAGKGAIDWLVGHRGKTQFDGAGQETLQRTFQAFIEEGRSFSDLRSLTAEVFRELEPGRYFYAVDDYGRVRFGRMHTREDDPLSLWSERIKSYECLLFPGQPILAAGEFQIVEGDPVLEANLDGASPPARKLGAVNAFSGHYFFRPCDKRLERHLRDMSDKYLESAGHFLKAVRDMGIAVDGITLSKF